MAEVQLGTRVLVFSADFECYLGEGVYAGEVPIPEEQIKSCKDMFPADTAEIGAVLDSMTTPRIQLDSGGIILGCECYWTTRSELPGHLIKLMEQM